MVGSPTSLSVQLVGANQQLQALREQYRATTQPSSLFSDVRRLFVPPWALDDDINVGCHVPGTEREVLGAREQGAGNGDQLPPANNRPPNVSHQPPDWVKLYPAIGLGMLKQEVTSPGRVWVFLRHLNTNGQG